MVASVSELVYVEPVEIEVGVNLIVSLGKVFLPLGVARIEEIDVALPA